MMDYNKLLSELADEIDITDSQEGAIRTAYNGVADWLNQNNADIARHNVHIFPQGSMMYGTAVKPISEDDYDIDLVCEFRDNVEDLEPEYVKKSVGKRISENARYRTMLQPEGRRCWTLQYCDSLNFHMDILPAIPFKERYYRSDSRLFEAYNNMSIMRELALLATDKNKETKKYRFIPSNPRGYAEWFKEKTLIGHNEKGMLFENIERVPTYPKKTVLQKSIQILKRHRDVYFLSRNDEYKPISMIITTLAAQCYNGENNIYEFICKALLKMPTLIVRENDQYVVKNPVMSNENFADKWKEKTQKAVEFFNWINDAYVDFVNLKELTTYSEVDKTFKEIFSQKPVDRLMQKYGEYLREEKNTSYCPQIIEKSKALTMLERIPHRKRPPWNLPRKFRVGIQGTVSFDSGKSYQNFSSGELLPKGVFLQFFPIHSLPTPYTVKWQITNTGNEARNAGCLRGVEFEDAELRRSGILCGKKEETSYAGTHYIQCFIIRNGNQCIGMSQPFVVKIKE